MSFCIILCKLYWWLFHRSFDLILYFEVPNFCQFIKSGPKESMNALAGVRSLCRIIVRKSGVQIQNIILFYVYFFDLTNGLCWVCNPKSGSISKKYLQKWKIDHMGKNCRKRPPGICYLTTLVRNGPWQLRRVTNLAGQFPLTTSQPAPDKFPRNGGIGR